MYEVALFPGLSLKAGCKGSWEKSSQLSTACTRSSSQIRPVTFDFRASMLYKQHLVQGLSELPALTCLLPLWADTYVTSAL